MSEVIPEKFFRIINKSIANVNLEHGSFNYKDQVQISKFIKECFTFIHQPFLDDEQEIDTFWVCLQCFMEPGEFEPEDSLYGEINLINVHVSVEFSWDKPLIIGGLGEKPALCPNCESTQQLIETKITSPTDFQRQAAQDGAMFKWAIFHIFASFMH